MTKKELARFRRRRERIKALIAQGVKQTVIARMLGISKQRVGQLAR